MIKICCVSKNGFFASLTEYLENGPDVKIVGHMVYANGTGAIVKLLEPDIVLMDMDDVAIKDFLLTINHLKGENPSVKLVAITSSIDEQHFLYLIEAGIDSLLMKQEYDNRKLVGAIQSIMDDHFIIPPAYTRTLVIGITDLENTGIDLFIQKLHEKEIFLTRREMDVAYMMKQGLTNKDIAANLQLSEGTVKVHVSRIYGKVGRNKRKEVVALFNELLSNEVAS